MYLTHRAVIGVLVWLSLACPLVGKNVPSEALWAATEYVRLRVVHVVYSAGPEHFIGLLSSMISVVIHLSDQRKCYIHLILSHADLQLGKTLVECFHKELHAAGIKHQPNVEIHRLRPLAFNLSKGSNQRIMTHHTFSPFTFMSTYHPNEPCGLTRTLSLLMTFAPSMEER